MTRAAAVTIPSAPSSLAGVACPLCAAACGSPAGLRDDGVAFTECRACGLAYADPPPSPEAVRALYRGDYFGVDDGTGPYRAYEAYDPAAALAADPRRWEVALIESHAPPGGLVLEVGCGSGRLLEALQSRGRLVAGVELNPAMAARVRLRLRSPVFEQPLEERLPLPSRSVAVIAALSVLEHTPRPAAFLDEISRLLAPGGLLLITTPNYASAARAGSDWIGWKGQWDHLCYFSPGSLAAALEARGFVLAAAGSSGPPASHSRLASRRPLKRLKRRLQALPGLGARLTDWKRRLRPPRLAPVDVARADYVALYRKTVP